MRIAGSCRIAAPRQQVWDALQDPAVLVRTLPGCQTLEVTGPDAYAATVTAGVASVRGTYHGTVALTDKQEPDACRMTAEGAGTPGTIRADALVRLEEDGDGTLVHYEAEAIVGGMLGGVGQRMIAGVATRTADEFFAAVEQDLAAAPSPAAAPPVPAEPAAAGEELVADMPEPLLAPSAEPAAAGRRPEVGEVFTAPSRPRPDGGLRQALAALVGAAIALAGVLVGRRMGGGGSR